MRTTKSDIWFLNQFFQLLRRVQKGNIPEARQTANQFTSHNRKSIVSVLEILAQANLIAGYLISPKTVQVRLFRKQRGGNLIAIPFSRIDLFSTPSRYTPISYHKLKKLKIDDPFSIYFLYTNHGVISGAEAIQKKIGGISIAKVGL